MRNCHILLSCRLNQALLALVHSGGTLADFSTRRTWSRGRGPALDARDARDDARTADLLKSGQGWKADRLRFPNVSSSG